jgi:uncharacterized protein (TIGR02145 family)
MKTESKNLINPFIIIGLIVMFSTSCKKDNENFDTVVDIDGNSYHTVIIGTQVWMVENLKTTKYNDGSLISNVTDSDEWFQSTTGAYCNYNNDPSNGNIYGRLYNWYAIETNKLAPQDWHVPSDAEWTTLKDYLMENGYNFDSTTVGNQISKSLASTYGWAPSDEIGDVGNNQASNNRTGFTALPGGCRYVDGLFCNIGEYGSWWSSTSYSTTDAYMQLIGYGFGHIIYYYNEKYCGLSVRCIKD